MKNAVFFDVAPCEFIKNERFEGTYRLHLQGRRNNSNVEKMLDGNWLAVYNKPTRCHIPGGSILQLLK
jgi:hypothetical protein